jgi:D-cysteine desulfhydrase
LGGGLAIALERMNRIASARADTLERLRGGATNPLFDIYPALGDRIPWRPLGTYPTPLVEFALPFSTPGTRLFIKRDDLASRLYGGNKVRKLEYLLAEAALLRRDSLITLGALGSNHALATALHGAALGFEVDLALYDQPVTPFVQRNFSGFLAAGARLHYGRTIPGALLLARRIHRRRIAEGRAPYFVMVGGTTRLGCFGHLSAALELGRQVADGIMPEPDVVYAPLGTSGTAAGLVVGLKLAGLRSRVAAVRVADAIAANSLVLRYLAQDLADFLHAADPSVPRLTITSQDFDVLPNYIGDGYGLPTAAGKDAIDTAAAAVELDTTYTGKSFAACLDYCRNAPPDRVVLFWNTFNSAPVPRSRGRADAPAEFRHLVGLAER